MTELHFSQLKHIGTSPAHYAYNLTQPFKPSRDMVMGSAIDALIFGTSPVVECTVRRNKRDKAYQDFLEAIPEDAVVLSGSEHDTVRRAVDALLACSDAVELLQGEQQRTINWQIQGRPCRGTPDVFTDSRIVDLKKTRCANPDKFKWDAKKFQYHTQLAWYRNGLLECPDVRSVSPLSGRTYNRSAYIVTVETAPPFPVVCYELSDRALDLGDRTWRLWFERLQVCEESDSWPGYAQSIVPLDFDSGDSVTLTIDGEEFEVWKNE